MLSGDKIISAIDCYTRMLKKNESACCSNCPYKKKSNCYTLLLKDVKRIIEAARVRDFIYCDTDSVHALCDYDDCDDKELGKVKCEGVYKYALYLAPKSYIMFDGEHYEVHCKGVSTKVVEKEITETCKTFSEACEVFKPNRTFKCLAGLNVQGGKALLYVDKMILNDENMQINKKVLGDLEDVEW